MAGKVAGGQTDRSVGYSILLVHRGNYLAYTGSLLHMINLVKVIASTVRRRTVW